LVESSGLKSLVLLKRLGRRSSSVESKKLLLKLRQQEKLRRRGLELLESEPSLNRRLVKRELNARRRGENALPERRGSVNERLAKPSVKLLKRGSARRLSGASRRPKPKLLARRP